MRPPASPFCEHPRGAGEAEGEQGKLKMLLVHLELQVAYAWLQDGYMKVNVVQVQSHHPVTWIQGRQNLGQHEHLNLSFCKKAFRRRRAVLLLHEEIAGVTASPYFWDLHPIYGSFGQKSLHLLKRDLKVDLMCVEDAVARKGMAGRSPFGQSEGPICRVL